MTRLKKATANPIVIAAFPPYIGCIAFFICLDLDEKIESLLTIYIKKTTFASPVPDTYNTLSYSSLSSFMMAFPDTPQLSLARYSEKEEKASSR